MPIEHVKVPEAMKEVIVEVEPKVSLADKIFGIFKMKRVEDPVEEERRTYCIREWKQWEIAYLRENYEIMRLKDMAAFLDRPRSTIYSKMQREGIIKK